MAKFNFNSANVEPMAARSFDPLPRGDYEMMIVKSDVKPTQAGTGHYIELEMHVIGGEQVSWIKQMVMPLHNLPIQRPAHKAGKQGNTAGKQLTSRCHLIHQQA